MFPAIRVTTAWLTTAMLLAQSVFLGSVLDRSCQESSSLSCFVAISDAGECCCSPAENDYLSVVVHCHAPSCDDESTTYDWAVCYCGDHTPSLPAVPILPESPNPTCLFNWGCGGTICLTIVPILTSDAVQAQVDSSELLVPHFKQILQCVWLT